jgi:hypothetical protein
MVSLPSATVAKSASISVAFITFLSFMPVG